MTAQGQEAAALLQFATLIQPHEHLIINPQPAAAGQ
jgi:hypothetical protein